VPSPGRRSSTTGPRCRTRSPRSLPPSRADWSACSRPLVAQLGPRRPARNNGHRRSESRRTSRVVKHRPPEAPATGRVRSPPVHSGYTRDRQIGECSGHQRSQPVPRNRRSARQHSRHQAALQEAGQSSSLPTSTHRRPAEALAVSVVGAMVPGAVDRGHNSRRPCKVSGSKCRRLRVTSGSPLAVADAAIHRSLLANGCQALRSPCGAGHTRQPLPTEFDYAEAVGIERQHLGRAPRRPLSR
jgi:hypothetical protein